MKMTVFGLSLKRFVITLLFGLMFWFDGVLMVRTLTKYQLHDGLAQICVFILSVLAAWLAIASTKKLLRVSAGYFFTTVTLITGVVNLIHGITLSLYPHLYAMRTEDILSGTIWIIWFTGIVLIITIFINGKLIKC